jgi:hypothetical protein
LADHPMSETAITSRSASHIADVQNPSSGRAHRSIRLAGDSPFDLSRIGDAMAAIGPVRCFIHDQKANIDAAVAEVIGVSGCCNTLLNQVEQTLHRG